MSLSDPQIAAAATIYLAGAVAGALLFGHLTDRHGRKKLFLITLATYSLATVGTAFSVNLVTFAVCRFFTGLGIGGVGAPILFGVLIASGSRTHVAYGYLLGAGLMLCGALCEKLIGVEAAGKSLEAVSRPLQSEG